MSETEKKSEPKRTNLFWFNPLELCIVGGAVLDDKERGPLDTEEDPTHPLYDERLRTTEISEEFLTTLSSRAGEGETGRIDTPITFRRIKGVPCVVVGRKRVRAARIMNVRGEHKPMLVPAVPADDGGSDLALMERMIIENEGREGDTFEVKVSKLKRYMALVEVETGEKCTNERAAAAFNMKPQQVKAWLKFDGTASDDVKRAVFADKLSVSAGMEISRNAKTPEAQEKALAAALAIATTGKKTSTQAVRNIAKRVVRPDAQLGCPTARLQRKLLELVQHTAHSLPKNTSEKTYAWYQGVEDTLQLILGDEAADKRLVDMLERVREAAATKAGAA